MTTLRFTLKFKDDDAPDLGMGAGVIAYQDSTWDIDLNDERDNPMLMRTLLAMSDEFMKSIVAVVVEEVEPQ